MFLNRQITLNAEQAAKALEVRAVPHVVVAGQFFDSSGKPTSSYAPHLFGQTKDPSPTVWFGETQIDGQGKFVAKAPKGLDVRLNLIDNEHHALKTRLSKDAPLCEGRDVDLGTLEQDMTDLMIIRYTAPVLLVKAVKEDGQLIAGASPAIAYQTSDPLGSQYLREGKPVGYVSFEHQNDGRWRTSQLQPDLEFTLTVEAAGYEPKSEKLKLPEGEVKGTGRATEAEIEGPGAIAASYTQAPGRLQQTRKPDPAGDFPRTLDHAARKN